MFDVNEEPQTSFKCPSRACGIGTITLRRRTLGGETIGGRLRCTKCGRNWELARGTRHPLGCGRCPDCGNLNLVEIQEQDGLDLVCFECGLETSLEDMRSRRARRTERLEEEEREEILPAQVVFILLWILGIIFGIVISVLILSR